MAEVQARVVAGLEHLLGDRLAQRGVECFVLDLGYVRDRALVERATDRDHARGLLAGLGQPLDPQHERVAEALGGGAAPVEPGGQQFLRVQRVALAAGKQPVHELLGGRVAEDVGERLSQLAAVKRDQFEPARGRQALELGQQRAQSVAAVQLVAAVGQEHHHPLLAQAPGQECHERPRGAVGPMHVLEDQHGGLGLPEQVQ